jgi:hypothetical protein
MRTISQTVLRKQAGLFRPVTGAAGRPMSALPGIPRFGAGKSLKTTILAFLLLLLPAFFLGAQQSFFIAPGQTIRNGDIARGYCLEYAQKRLTNDNIAGLLQNIEGIVKVIYYIDKASEDLKLQDLVTQGLVYFNAFDSFQHLQFFFSEDSGIEEIVPGDDGISFFREKLTGDENTPSPGKMTADEEKLARENITKILALEARKLLHHTIQEYIWRTRFPLDIPVEDIRTIDFQTTSDPAEQVHTQFGGNATVDYRRDGQQFMRLDGILNGTEDFSRDITELVSHFHNDHINHATLGKMLETGNFAELFAPYAALEDSRNQTFNLLTTIMDNPDYNSKLENRLLEITNADTPLTRAHIGSIGDLYYSKFVYGADIQLDVFKYKNPKNPNTDGAIYQITHKNVGFLLFGDFDDPGGIENLLNASVENEGKRAGLQEQCSDLIRQLYELEQKAQAGTMLLDLFGSDSLFEDDLMAPDSEMRTLFTALGNRTEELVSNIKKLQNKIASLPVLKADVVKWPHHAHVFTEANSRDVIVKLNEVVDPRYFIYQVHHAQDLEKFEAFIKDFEFRGKFINSGVKPVKFISMEWLKTQFLNLFTGKQKKAS